MRKCWSRHHRSDRMWRNSRERSTMTGRARSSVLIHKQRAHNHKQRATPHSTTSADMLTRAGQSAVRPGFYVVRAAMTRELGKLADILLYECPLPRHLLSDGHTHPLGSVPIHHVWWSNQSAAVRFPVRSGTHPRNREP